VAERLAGAVAHAIMALKPPALLRRPSLPRWVLWALPAALLLLLLVPVPMMAVAPVEVVADEPLIVAAPMEGVIADVPAAPNVRVSAGDVLFVYDDTELKAKAEIAARREAVALARLETLRKAAFGDTEARQGLAKAKAGLNLARAERAHAEQLLAEVRVRAPKAGIVVYSDLSDWIRKPVRTGERVMEIADPARVVMRIDLPVRDAIVLEPGARVRVFLDADPMRVVHARVRTASFHAEETPGGLLAYRVMAALEEGETSPGTKGGEMGAKETWLRIGFRGSAQVMGRRVPLGFYLFRRPVASFRQFFGL